MEVSAKNQEQDKEQSKAQLNYWRFRLAVTLQDMAMLKIEMGKYEDSLLHLQETETMLRNVLLSPQKSKDSQISAMMKEVADERNQRLANQAQKLLQQRLKSQGEQGLVVSTTGVRPVLDSEQEFAEYKKQGLVTLTLVSGAFAVGFLGAKLVLDRMTA